MRKFLIIVFLFLYIIAFAQGDYRVITSTSEKLIIEYTPNYSQLDTLVINGNKYLDFNILNGLTKENKIGSPIIPYRLLSVGVPNEYGNTISVINVGKRELSGKLKPVPNVKKENNFPKYLYQENENYQKFKNYELVTFGDFGLVRDLPVQNIVINPVQFYPEQNKIVLYNKIVFQINFSSVSKKNPLDNADIYNDLVINSKVSRSWANTTQKLAKVDVESQLATGDWYRFEATEEGIYKIDKEFLSDLGINVNSIDPRTIKIFNNGGYILNWTLSKQRPNGLVENAIRVEGEEDGIFNDNDLILFYGRGVDFFEYNSVSNDISRNKHYYSKKNYYWLTFGGSQGKRMEIQPNLNEPSDYIQKQTDAFRFQDVDNQNLMGSGLLYVEDDYTSSSKSKTYLHNLDGRVQGTTVKYSFQFINGSKTSNRLSIEENGVSIFDRFLTGPSNYWIDYRYGAATKTSVTYNGNIPDYRSVLKFTFTPSSISDKGHLDFLEIRYRQDMNSLISEIPLIFYSDTINGVIEYQGTPFNTSNFKVYNVTEYDNVKIVDVQYNGGFIFKSNEDNTSRSKYIATKIDDYKKPTNAVKVENSNLRGITQGAKYVIITHRNFEEQAERLKNYRQNESPYTTSVLIAYVDQIYNEFSGGSLDPTAIRDFLSYGYSNWQIKPEYVLLFGDGDFDYFNTLGKNLNFIPTFQTVESLYEIGSYPYDDYYSRIVGDDDFADVGIGRLSVTTNEEAEIVVDKIIKYETSINTGLWTNRITLLADDGLTTEGDDGSIHTNQSENLSKNYIPDEFDQVKIYLSNFPTVNTGLGRRKPTCNDAIIESINNGTLIFNYVGHGNPDVWAHEIVFERSVSIPQLNNEELFFLTAATCDFGKYDDPNLQSATEEMILMRDAGMIGGLSAVRPVFSGQNDALNRIFYSYLLWNKDENNIPITIGRAFQKLKQQRSGNNDEKFHLFGDPYIRLNIPKQPLKIQSINNISDGSEVNIKALGEVSISGEVLNLDSTKSNFQGEGIITVYDSERKIHLDDINYDMSEQGGVIFRGRVSVQDGNFETSFTVPKDISYENKNGKITAYVFNENTNGVGSANNIIVGGTDSSKVNDGKGPDIEILYDDETESSYLVNPNFKLRIKLFDETGLNTTGAGIGHKLEAILNDDEQNSIDLTNYFVGDLNSGGKSGEVNYNFSSLEPGEYKIKVNAWDVYNNFSSREDFFTVVSTDDLVIREVYNYPNPFSNNTYFTFQHNLTAAVNVKIKIYTVAGRVIKEIEKLGIDNKFVKIYWNGRDEDNSKIGNGTYLYKLIVESTDGKYKDNVLGKMAVIR